MEETLGKRIAANRKKLALTQDALAEQLGVTAQAVSKWENDQSCPDISMLPRLAEIFHITIDELLGIRKPEPEPHPSDPQEAEPVNTQDSISTVPSFRQRLSAPGLGLALWMVLTGAILIFMKVRYVSVSFWDIALGAAITVFGVSGFFRSLSLLRLGCAIGGSLHLWSAITTDSLGIYTDWSLPLAIGLTLLGMDLLLRSLRWGSRKHPKVFNLSGHKDPSKNYCTYQGETFQCETNFGEGDRQIQLPRLSGGRGEVNFGQLHIDLTACPEIAEGCQIDLECSFGSLEILIPRKYRVEIASSSAFGNVETKGAPDPGAESTLYLTCDANFGQITIRHI